MPAMLQFRKSRDRSPRTVLSRKYLAGCGIEVGALARPVCTPHAHVQYYDRFTEEELSSLYPHLAGQLVDLNGIIDLESLDGIANQSLDFIIACRVLEYTGNVLAAFHAICRVLKRSGIAYLSITDKRKTADCHRPVTPLGHLAADFVHGPSGSWTGHLEEWATFIEYGAGDDPDARLQLALQHAHRIRQHVWTPHAWMELLLEMQKDLQLELESWHVTSREIITILRKA